MKRSEDLLESLFERGIREAEAGAAQPDVREHGVGPEVIRQDRTDRESGRHPGYSAHTQRAVRETSEGRRELVQPDRIGVHEEVAAAHLAMLGEMHQRAGAVLDVNGRHPRRRCSNLQNRARLAMTGSMTRSRNHEPLP
jgi:hypothetical protein